MPWTDSVHTSPNVVSPSLPDPESVRLEALRRSWQRDRQVASRRLRRRWVVWAALRYGLPLVIVLGTSVMVWTWALPSLWQTHAPRWARDPGTLNVIDPSPSVLHQAIPSPGESPPDPQPAATATPDSLRLRADRGLPLSGGPDAAAGPSSQASGDKPVTERTVDPSLQPTHVLNNKEP